MDITLIMLSENRNHRLYIIYRYNELVAEEKHKIQTLKPII